MTNATRIKKSKKNKKSFKFNFKRFINNLIKQSVSES